MLAFLCMLVAVDVGYEDTHRNTLRLSFLISAMDQPRRNSSNLVKLVEVKLKEFRGNGLANPADLSLPDRAVQIRTRDGPQKGQIHEAKSSHLQCGSAKKLPALTKDI